MFFSL
jgi:hypothetical protein